MRRIIKGVLFFAGLAVAVAAMTCFAMDFIQNETLVLKNVYITSIVVGAGIIAAGFALQMHAKDVIVSRRSLSVFCRIFGIFWLVTGGINLVGSTVLLIIFT